MNMQSMAREKTHSAGSVSAPRRGVLQRKCACGGSAGPSGECSECGRKRLSGGRLQTKLRIGAANDPLEKEADMVARQVTADTVDRIMSRAPSCVQRMSGQPMGQSEMAPASVGRVLSTSGEPLRPALKQDMERRFGYDFSQVRLHADSLADRSAREVNARAYTVGNNIVFSKGQLHPEQKEGRWLLAHELTHVIQQTGASRITGIRSPERVFSPNITTGGREAIRRVGECRGRNGFNCNGVPCVTATGRRGVCTWGGVRIGCNCRDQSGDEPPPVGVKFRMPSWLKWVLGAVGVAAVAACFATGVCEFGAVVGGLSAAAAAAVIAILESAGIRDSGGGSA